MKDKALILTSVIVYLGVVPLGFLVPEFTFAALTITMLHVGFLFHLFHQRLADTAPHLSTGALIVGVLGLSVILLPAPWRYGVVAPVWILGSVLLPRLLHKRRVGYAKRMS